MGISKNFEYSKWVWAKNIWVHIFELKFFKKNECMVKSWYPQETELKGLSELL